MNNLYVAKKYEIEYSKAFNGINQEGFNHFLSDECESYWGDGDDVYFSNNVEVDEAEFLSLIEKVENLSEKEFAPICSKISYYEYEKSEIVKFLKELYENADKRDSMLHFIWF